MNQTMNRNILVTGGAGFIGSHLCEYLHNEGNTVTSLDNYSTGSTDNHIDGVTYIEGHTKDIDILLTSVPDVIFHLGEYARPLTSFDDVETVWDLNTQGSFKVFEYCRKNNVRIVYAGSSTKYGDGGEGKDQSPYAWTKASNTELLCRYGEWFDLDYVITYFYNVYGPRERSGKYGTLIEIFKEKMQKGEPLTVVSPGTQKRNFTHVKDIVRGIILAEEKGKGDGYSLGHPESYTIREVAEMFGGEIVELPPRQGDRKESSLNLEKTSRELGWSPEYDLETYISSVLAEMKEE